MTLMVLPATTPFGDAVSQTDEYWTSTAAPGDGTAATTVVFGAFSVLSHPKQEAGPRLWCVRGGVTVQP